MFSSKNLLLMTRAISSILCMDIQKRLRKQSTLQTIPTDIHITNGDLNTQDSVPVDIR